MLKCSYCSCIQDGEGLASAGVNGLCIVLKTGARKLVKSTAERIKIKSGLVNGCTAARVWQGKDECLAHS